VTAGEAVLELAALWEDEAAVLRKRHADERAELLEQLAEEVRDVVASRMSPWVSLADVQERTGWCAHTLREKAKELKPRGLARKIGGSWHFERDAASRILPKRPAEPVRPEEWSDPRAVARRLAREE